MEQKLLAIITSTDFARVFEYGNELQVTSVDGMPLRKHFQFALKNLSDPMF